MGAREESRKKPPKNIARHASYVIFHFTLNIIPIDIKILPGRGHGANPPESLGYLQVLSIREKSIQMEVHADLTDRLPCVPTSTHHCKWFVPRPPMYNKNCSSSNFLRRRLICKL